MFAFLQGGDREPCVARRISGDEHRFDPVVLDHLFAGLIGRPAADRLRELCAALGDQVGGGDHLDVRVALEAKVGAEFGTLNEKETTIINNLLELEKLTVRDIMTPRTVMIMGEEDMTVKEFYEDHDPLRYSRIPLYKEKNSPI